MCFSQTEKDDTVGESSPHIANIGRLVEVGLTANVFFLITLTIRSNETDFWVCFCCLRDQALTDGGLNNGN